MTKKSRVLSMILAAVMVITTLSVFSISYAIDPQVDAKKEAANLDMFCFTPFDAVSNPGYGTPVEARDIVFVENNWAGAKNNSWVYMDFGGKIYKAIFGVNAFSSIATAITTKGHEGLIVKVGSGTYSDTPTGISYHGITFYGNYAGINPNVDGKNTYTKNLNPKRDPAKETILTGQWTWSANRYNMVIEGFTISEGCGFTLSNLAQFYFRNNIFENITSENPINAGGGYTSSVYIENNRFIGLSKRVARFGTQNSDININNNYFENCKDDLLSVVSTGNKTGYPSLVSFSGNIVNSCKTPVYFEYSGNGGTTNYCFNKVTDNYFYNCSGDSIVYIRMWTDHPYNGAYPPLYDPQSTTLIARNTFDNVSNKTSIVFLDGQESYGGIDETFSASVINNKFIFKSPTDKNNIAIKADITGNIDASYNYTNAVSKSSIYSVDANLVKSIVTMPAYQDEAMTKLINIGSLKWNERTMGSSFNTTLGTYGVDIDKMGVYATALEGKQSVTIDNKMFIASDADYQLYYDFNITRPVDNNIANLTGDKTYFYIVMTDKTTKQAVKYSFVINSKTDKTKAELVDIYNKETDKPVDDYRISADGKTYYITLDGSDINFPFYAVVSPSATVKYYTNSKCTKEYKDDKYYMKPDDVTAIYTKVTSGDGKTSNVYKLEFKRAGSDEVDANIKEVITPRDDIVIFNNERKSVIYSPLAMVEEVTFDFIVSDGATYNIYKDKACKKLLSSKDDVKPIKVGDGVTTYYIEVTNTHGYETIYKLVCQNDTKSTDNIITGITGVTEGVTIENNVITIEASTTLAAVNAHFETNAFADVKVYADSKKSYALEPSITMAMVNNREVEVRTFQLGISNKVSYFYVDVTAEAGKKNSYKVVVFKRAQVTEFGDIKGHWAEKTIKDVANLGLVSGYTDSSSKTGYVFRPNNNATRQEIAILLCRMLGIEPLAFKAVSLGDAFTDASKIPEWSYEYVKGAYALGFMVGSDGKFNPTAKITRQEFFQAIATILDLDKKAASSVSLSKFKDANKLGKWAVAATKACIKEGIVVGDGNKLNPTAYITRAEIATILSKCTTIRDDVRYAE